MNPDKRRVRQQFDLGARHYHAVTPVQRQMAADLMRELPAGWCPERILEVGCGTGHLTQCLRATFPEAVIRATDLSPAMVAATASRMAGAAGVEVAVADAEALAASLVRPYPDLVVGNAVLQWLSEPMAVVRGLTERVAAGGCLAFATFGPGSMAELQALLGDFGVRHPLAALPGTEDWRAGLGDLACRVRRDEVVQRVPSAGQFLRELRQLGAGLAHAGMAFADLRELVRRYDALAMEDGIPVTWERIFVLIGPNTGAGGGRQRCFRG